MIIFLISPLLSAQEKEVTLEEVVVTATRDAQEVHKIPANVTVISKEEIDRSNAQNVVDVLRDQVGLVVRDYYGTGKNASVDIRGFGETGLLNTLVLVDGRRVNEIDLSGVDWTQIPLDQVERIEIIRGPGSVLYGDNAVGGVINIITKKPEKPFTVRGEVVRGSYLYHKESGSVGGKWGPLSAILNASYSSTEGYRENGLLRTKDIGGKVIYEIDDLISLNLRGGFHKDDSGLPGGLDPITYKIDRRATLDPNNKSSTEDGFGAIGINVKFWDWGRIETDFSYRHRTVENLFDYPTFFYTYQDERQLETLGVTPKYILDRKFWIFKNKLTVGLDFYNSDSKVKAKTTFFGFPSWSHIEVSKRSMGIYLLDEFSILPNLILSFGFREEWVTYDLLQKNPWSKDESRKRQPSYSLSLDYLFGKQSSAFFSFKRSFRFPVTDELILVFPVFRVNPAMKSQTGYHYEAGVRHSFTDWMEANLTLFWTDLRDEIFFNPITFSNENFPKTRRQGVEIGAKIKPFPWVTLWGNYGYIKPTLREPPFSGNDIPAVPRHKGSFGVDIDFGKGFVLNTKMNFVGSRHFVSDWRNQLDRLNGYYILDSKLSYTWKGLRAFIGVNNLFNRRYVEWGVTNGAGTTQIFYPSPERSIIGGLSYTF